MPKIADTAKLLGVGCGVIVGFAILGMFIGVVWANQHQNQTGIDSGNAPAFFLVLGALVGIIVSFVYAFIRTRRSA